MKKIKSSLIILLVLVLLSNISLATVSDSEGVSLSTQINTSNISKVVTISEEKIEPNKEFYLILNLSNISFTKFKVDITNTSSLSANEITTRVSSLSTNSVVTSFEVDKNSISLDKLGIVYTSPKQPCVVKFEVKITNLDETEESLKQEQLSIQTELSTLKENLEKLNETLNGLKSDFEKAKTEGLEENSEKYKEFETTIANAEKGIEQTESDIKTKEAEAVEIKNKIDNFKENILEEAEIEVTNQINQSLSGMQEREESDAWNDKQNMLMMEEKNKEMTNSMKDMMTKMNSLETNLKDANNTISSLTKNVTYQGSQNNYLENLSIDGVTFKNSFKKTTLNYFAKVDEETEYVTVVATPEDSSAIVTIYGNTDLQKGQNKILVTVTADDESVRTYKIYVTK